MASNNTTNSIFNTDAYVSEDWYGGYKLEVDITTESIAEDWTLDFNLPYNVRDAYGVDLIDNGNDSYSISGQGNWSDLEKGETAKAIFIIDDNGQDAIVPEFTLQGSKITTQPETVVKDLETTEPDTIEKPSVVEASTTSDEPDSKINPTSSIVEDWNGGYKLEVDITTESIAEDWTLDFNLPYNVRDVYGVDLIDNGNDSYSISGQGNWSDLEKGETAKAIFIIDDNGKDAIVPEFILQGSKITTQPETVEVSEVSEAPTPTQISSDAITVGFEQHSNNTAYNTAAQNKDWNVDWSNNMYKYATISDEAAHSGDKSLKITYPSDAQTNAGSSWKVPGQKEYYLSYWVKFDQNFDFDGPKLSGGKLPGMGADDLCSGGATCTGTNGFSSRYMWRENGKATLYLYHMDKPGTYGEDITLQGSDGKDKYFEPGKWHNLVQRVKINDGNQSNGEIDVWMDQEQVLDMDNLKFVTDNQGIDTLYFSSFHGGNGSDWWPEREVNAHFDDFVISTNAADVGL